MQQHQQRMAQNRSEDGCDGQANSVLPSGTGPVRHLVCSCCGEDAGRWHQWHNRDTGYGLCAKCGEWIPSRTPFGRPSEYADPAEMNRCYGVPGIHRPFPASV